MHPYLIIFLFVVTCSCRESEKPTSEMPRSSRHSKDFNTSFQSWMNEYYTLSELFVKWDSAGVTTAAINMLKSMDKMEFDNKDSVIQREFISSREQLYAIGQPGVTLENKRKNFAQFSEKLYNNLQSLKYDAAKIYLHECTMPFNDTGRAVWLSKTEGIRNPYLGMYHPRYGSGMLECGTHEATINFASTKPNENEEKTDKSKTPNESKSKEKED